MQTRGKHFRWIFLLILIAFCFSAQAQEKKKIVVFGSSVAAGWVTSYLEQYDMHNGYAYRLQRYLNDCEVIVNCVPGDNTRSSLRRIKPDLLDLHPDYALIGLAMANEGLGRAPVDSVVTHYREGLKKIISLCREKGIEPIVGLCYPNDSFTPEDYETVRAMNIEVAQWDVPTINFLGALDDGKCNFPEGTTFEGDHPDNTGHEEMFFAIEPGVFRASYEQNVKSLNPRAGTEYRELAKDFSYVPQDVIHSFTFWFDFRAQESGTIADIQHMEGTLKIGIEKGRLEIRLDEESVEQFAMVDTGKVARVSISQYYLDSRIEVNVNGKHVLALRNRIEPTMFSLRKNTKAKFAGVAIYRSAMNTDEIELLNKGIALNGSLCVWSNFGIDSSTGQYENDVVFIPLTASAEGKSALKEKIIQAREARASQQEFPEKAYIMLPEEELREYAGIYEISSDDRMEIKLEGGELRLFDRGNSIGLRAESKDHFFVHAPYTFLIDFKRESSAVSEMVVTVMGNRLTAKKKSE